MNALPHTPLRVGFRATTAMSGIELSVRDEVIATVTLSKKNGRMSIFEDGVHEDYLRDQMGGVWRMKN